MPQWGSVKECILIRFDVSIFVRMYLCEHVSHTQCVLHGRVQTKHVSFRFMRILNLWCLATRNSIGYVFGSKNEVYTIDVTELILNAVALDARRFQTIFCFSAVPEKSSDPFGYWNSSHIVGLSFFIYWVLIWLHCWVENCGYSWKTIRYVSGILNHVVLCPPVTSWKSPNLISKAKSFNIPNICFGQVLIFSSPVIHY